MVFNETKSWLFPPLETMVTSGGLKLRRGDILYSRPSIRQEPWSTSIAHDWSGVQIVECSAVKVTFKTIESRSGVLAVSDDQTMAYDDFVSLLRG